MISINIIQTMSEIKNKELNKLLTIQIPMNFSNNYFLIILL